MVDLLGDFIFVLALLAVLATPAYVALIQMSRSIPNGIDMGHRISTCVIITTTIAGTAIAWIFGQIYDAARPSDIWFD